MTGGSRGLGRAIALELAALGHDVAINYLRDEGSAECSARLVRERGGEAWLLPGNVGDPAEAAAVVRGLPAQRPLHVLVHSAATGTFRGLLDVRANQLELTFRVNAFALAWLTRAALPVLAAPGGQVIAISSTGSARVVPDYGTVGASKAALESMVRYLAADLAPAGIAVNCVRGGLLETDASRALPAWEELARTAAERTPAGRMGTVADVARVVGMLAAGGQGWLCGQVLVADGGLSLR